MSPESEVQLAIQGQEELIPLNLALEQYYQPGDKYGDLSLLIRRTSQLPAGAHIPIEAVTLAYGMCRHSQPSLPYAVISHGPSYSVAEKVAILRQRRKEISRQLGIKETPVPIKTLTVEFKDGRVIRHFLLTGIGDFRVDANIKGELAKVFKTSKSNMGRMVLNPDNFDTTLFLGLIPGVVGSFVQPHLLGNYVRVVYLREKLNFPRFVAFAVSPLDTFIVEKPTFELLLDALYGYSANGIPFQIVDIGE